MKPLLLLFLVLLASTGCAATEQTIAVAEVPEVVLAAARAAVPGLLLTEAERETNRNGRVVYELEGTAEGYAYEIEVTAEGEVLEVEQEAAD